MLDYRTGRQILYINTYRSSIVVLTQPHRDRLSIAVYVLHHLHLVVPLQHVTLVDADGIDPIGAILSAQPHLFQEGPQATADRKRYAIEVETSDFSFGPHV